MVKGEWKIVLGEVIAEYTDVKDVGFHELTVAVVEYSKKASNEFHNDGDSAKVSHALAVAQRFLDELKIRAITTAL